MHGDPPRHDEIEVSIFGPGKGESIAVHIGGGEWIIVDSCVDKKSGEIPVLQYLHRIGVTASKAVKLVVGTHAHDDHIAGLSRVYDACESASFICSAALTTEEFLHDVNADADIEAQLRKTIRSEYRQIFETVKTRPVGRRLKHAQQELPLFSRQGTQDTPAAAVTAMSPSSEAFERARAEIAAGLSTADQRKRLRSTDPNDLAVALLITVGSTNVILGADLLRGPSGCGWNGVLAAFRPEPLASLFKVPHHGAPNAHHEDVWTQLLTDDVVAVLAPFRAGVTPRPQPEDVRRLKDRASAVYSSANPKRPAPARAVRRTQSMLSGIAQNVRTEGLSGQIRARRPAHGASNWDVTPFSPGMKL
ncbi:hypothetical protein C6A86_002325 [Mycobacterium sp. ITM-2016-00316]|uniref:hypothetical protein n=1 Tax=Mycobacterium sp. ITM-2016-00316 TaxID=2099695 RepID=UPI00287F6888|nr:hypothetical protein [Mycobacterium sp. ITM-2016-00316]WNG82560.1 hypothetical protein C6A86_002325 [Mycobacterium sp. ITM-2016-00316]